MWAITLLVFAAVNEMTDNAVTPAVLRMAVVDNSNSMSGERIGLVRSELTRILKSTPPSPSHPFALIVFDSSAPPAEVFTDPVSADAAIAKLHGNSGGTNIAAALEQAIAEIQRRSQVGHTIVLLFTDGEDANRKAIETAEANLDSLFSARKRKGLSQSVYLKQWGAGGLDQLAKRLRASGSADVVDVNSLIQIPVTLSPAISVAKVRRLDDQRVLEIDWQGSVSASESRSNLPSLFIRCITQNVQGTIEAIATTDGPPVSNRITLVQSVPDEDPLSLHFSAALSPSGNAVPTLPTPVVSPPTVEVPITLPPMEIRNSIVATLEMTEPPQWIDPISLRVRYSAKLKFEVTAIDPTPNMDRSSSFQIVPLAGSHLVGGTQTFTLPGPGTFTLPLAFEAALSNRGAPCYQLRYSLQFAIRPLKVPPYLTYVPREITFHEKDLRGPDPFMTDITATIKQVSPSQWLQLPNIAACEVEAVVKASGPVPPGTKLSIRSQRPVLRADILPKELDSVEQTIRLRIATEITGSAQVRTIYLDLQAIDDGRTGVELRGTRLEMPFVPPQALSLIHVDSNRQPASAIQATVWDDKRILPITVQPEIWGLPVSRSGPYSRVNLKCLTSHLTSSSQSIPLNQATTIELAVPPRQRPSFFIDEVQAISVSLTLSKNAVAVQPSQIRVIFRHQAPFKRLMVPLSVTLSILMTFFGAIRLGIKLTTGGYRREMRSS